MQEKWIDHSEELGHSHFMWPRGIEPSYTRISDEHPCIHSLPNGITCVHTPNGNMWMLSPFQMQHIEMQSHEPSLISVQPISPVENAPVPSKKVRYPLGILLLFAAGSIAAIVLILLAVKLFILMAPYALGLLVLGLLLMLLKGGKCGGLHCGGCKYH